MRSYIYYESARRAVTVIGAALAQPGPEQRAPGEGGERDETHEQISFHRTGGGFRYRNRLNHIGIALEQIQMHSGCNNALGVRRL